MILLSLSTINNVFSLTNFKNKWIKINYNLMYLIDFNHEDHVMFVKLNNVLRSTYFAF